MQNNNHLTHYLRTLLGKQGFKFLEKAIGYNEEVRQLVRTNYSQYQPDFVTYRDNYVKHDQGVQYLPQEGWNTLYKYLAVDKQLTLKDEVEDLSEVGKDFHDSITEFCENNKDIFAKFKLASNSLQVKEYLFSVLQNYLFAYQKRNRKGEEVDFIRVGLSIEIGTHLVKYCMYDLQDFQKMFTFQKVLSKGSEEKVVRILDAIINKDQEKLINIYKEMFNVAFDLSDNSDFKLFKFFNIYILYSTFKAYEENALSDKLASYVKSHFTLKYFLFLERVVLKQQLILGDLVIKSFCRYNLCEVKLIQGSSGERKAQQTYVINFSQEFREFLTKTMNVLRPILCRANVAYLQQEKLPIGLRIVAQNYNDFIHKNKTLSLKINEGSYLARHRPEVYLSIDQNYLMSFLQYKERLDSKEKDFKNFAIYSDWFAMFNVDIEDIEHLYKQSIKENNKEMQSLIEEIILYGLDLERSDYTKIEVRIPRNAVQLRGYWNKIVSSKRFLKGLLEEAVLYSIYRYFLGSSFIDTRGRLYLQGFFLNILNYPLARAFVKLYEPNKNVDYSLIQEAVVKHLTDERSKDKIRSMSEEVFLQQLDQDKLTYIRKYLKPEYVRDIDIVNSSVDDIANKAGTDRLLYLDASFEETLELLRPRIKQKKKLFYVQSLIMLRKNPQPEIANYYELDANASGLQMTSILLNSKQLAQVCNLYKYEDNPKIIDLYTIAGQEFSQNLEEMQESIRTFGRIFNIRLLFKENPKQIILNDETYATILGQPLDDQFKAFINTNISKSYNTDKLLYHLWNKMGTVFTSNRPLIDATGYKNLSWIMSPHYTDIPTYTILQQVNPQFLQYLFTIASGIRFLIHVYQCPWIVKNNTLYDRDLFKKAVMTYGYNSTSYGRINSFELYFKTKIPRNVSNNTKTRYSLKKIADVTELFFHKITQEYLKPCENLKDISVLLSREKKPIYIRNEFCNITFKPYKMKSTAIQLPTRNKKRGTQLKIQQRTDEIDMRRVRSAFAPNLIHTMDAFIVHLFRKLMYLINKTLKHHNILINGCTNHDTFILLLTPYLQTIIEDCYYSVIRNNYINNISTADNKVMPLIKKKIFQTNKPQISNQLHPNLCK